MIVSNQCLCRFMWTVLVIACVGLVVTGHAASVFDSSTCQNSPCVSSPCANGAICQSSRYGPYCEYVPNTELAILANDGGLTYGGAENYGFSMASSANGTILAVGTPKNTQTSMINVLTKVPGNDNWNSAQVSVANSQVIGASIDISSDGTVIAIGSTDVGNGGDNGGAIYVIQTPDHGVTWIPRGEGRLVDFFRLPGWSSGEGTLGSAVAFNADATTLAGGDSQRTSVWVSGSVTLWYWDGGKHVLFQHLYESMDYGNLQLGAALDFSYDGSYLAVGAPVMRSSLGGVFLYNRTSNCANCTFATPGRLITPPPQWELNGDDAAFGSTVAFSGIHMFFVGAPLASISNPSFQQGAVFVVDSTWSVSQRITGTLTDADSVFGRSIASTFHATAIVVGAPTTVSGTGGALVCTYVQSPMTFLYEMKWCDDGLSGTSGNQIGMSVAITSDGRYGFAADPVFPGTFAFGFVDPGTYRCDCVAGYSGIYCQTDVNECSSSPCVNGGTCHDQVNSFFCSCAMGYNGNTCAVNINECGSQPCLNGASCVDQVNSFFCACAGGYSGMRCETNVDECSSLPCLNGGTCVDGIGQFTCQCTASFEGLTCQLPYGDAALCPGSPCASMPCHNGGLCTSRQSGPACEGAANYELFAQPDGHIDYNATNGAVFGSIVSMSGNGKLVAMAQGGAPVTPPSAMFSVYRRPSTSVSFNARTLVSAGTGWTNGDINNVVITSDGITIVASAADDQSNTGIAWVYNSTDNGVTWNQKGAELVDPVALGDNPNTQFGFALAITNDALTVAASEPFQNPGGHQVGAVALFYWNGMNYQLFQRLVPDNPNAEDILYGYSIAFNVDGGTFVAGGIGYNQVTGAVFVHNRTASCSSCLFSSPGRLVTPIDLGLSNVYGEFGWSIAFSGINRFFVGAPVPGTVNDPNASFGVVFVVDYIPAWGNWSVVDALSNYNPRASFGYSIAANAAATVLLVGVTNYTPDPSLGTACSYKQNTATGRYEKQWCAVPDPGGATLGNSVTLSSDGKAAAIGEPGLFFQVAAFSDYDGFNCTCSVDYSGTLCQVPNPCASFPCGNGGSCLNTGNSFSCTCASGYSGSSCQTDINECASSPCWNGGTCHDQVNSYFCTCPPGYISGFCQFERNECLSTPCQNGGTCHDQFNSFSCTCTSGYQDDTCQTNIDECTSTPCMNGGTCIDGVDQFTCMCIPYLYTGRMCQTLANDDAGACLGSPCVSMPCQNGGVCNSQQYGPACEGVPNYELFYQQDVNADYAPSGTNWFGFLVAMNGNGTLVAMASVATTSPPIKHLSVYRRPSIDVSFNGYTLVPVGTGWHDGTFATSIAMTQDGTALVASSYDDSSNHGIVWVYNSTDGGVTWNQRGPEITDNFVFGSTTAVDFGFAVAITNDALTVAASSPYQNPSLTGADGMVVIYYWNGANHQRRQRIFPVNLAGVDLLLGWALAFNAAGNVLVASAPAYNSLSGAVFVYNRTVGCPSCTFVTPGQLVTPPPSVTFPGVHMQFGYSLAFSGINRFFVGAIHEGIASQTSSDQGAVFVVDYVTATQNWTATDIITSHFPTAHLGSSVATTAAATSVMIGGPGWTGNSGIACSYRLNPNTNVYDQTWCSSPDLDGSFFGYSVAISSDGKAAAIGERKYFQIAAFSDYGGYNCTCQLGYSGHACEITLLGSCASMPCQNGGSCHPHLDSFVCSCASGYSGTTCQTDVDECASSPCRNGGTCADQLNGFKCTCPSAFHGPNCGQAGWMNINAHVCLMMTLLICVAVYFVVCGPFSFSASRGSLRRSVDYQFLIQVIALDLRVHPLRATTVDCASRCKSHRRVTRFRTSSRRHLQH